MRRRRVLAGMVGAALVLSAVAGCSSSDEPEATVPTPSPTPVTAAPSPTAVAVDEAPVTPSPSTASAAPRFHHAPMRAHIALDELERAGRDADAALVERIASQPTARWVADWTASAAQTVASYTGSAARADEVALLVVYAIPGRDCGLYSAGGFAPDAYVDFVGEVAGSIDPDARTWVVLEPDALAQLGDCEGEGDRVALLAEAAAILDGVGAEVFLDVGHSGWHTSEEMIARLGRVGTEHLAGFATNTSNYRSTEQERAFADPIAAATGLDYVIDTSRNGRGSDGEWCNARGRSLGEPPRIYADGPLRATAWVKPPGESDGECNGGPAAGVWWEEIALELARNVD